MATTVTTATAIVPTTPPLHATMSPPPTPKPASTPSPPPPPSPSGRYQPVQPGGSLLVAYQVRNRPVLVVGGGIVAAGRILSLLNADAYVHVVCPLVNCCIEVQYRIRTCAAGSLTHHDQNYDAALVHALKPVLVLTAVDDPGVSTAIYQLCHSLRIPVNVADVPPECDFYFGSMHRDGPLQIMVSTNGNGPKLANIVRRQIAGSLPDNLGAAITRVGVLRLRLPKMAPAYDEGPKRMEWMSRVCEEWTLEELCELGEIEMEALLDGYRDGRVVRLREIRGDRGDAEGKEVYDDDDNDIFNDDDDDDQPQDCDKMVFEDAFDGSFGWP